MTFFEAIAVLLLVTFGLLITWQDGNVGEGQNFILAGAVIAYVINTRRK